MTKKIFKYDLQIASVQQIELPIGAEIITVQTQEDELKLWALVDPNLHPEATAERTIEVYGTGYPIEDGDHVSRKYISTFQLLDGKLVFHVFERIV